MQYPVPTHLKDVLVLNKKACDEYEVSGRMRCPCGCEQFEVLQSNDRQIVYVKCTTCGKTILLFDAEKHGWDGFVCHEDWGLDRNAFPAKETCAKCGDNAFLVDVSISSCGREDFEDECDELPGEEWVNAFEWITVGLTCVKCGCKDGEWLDTETM